MIKKQHPTSLCGSSKMAQTLYKNSHDQMLRHYTKAYWESISLVNLKAIYLGISKVTQFHVWRMIKRKYCGIFHGIWKNAPETVPTDTSVLDKMNKKWYIMDGTVCVSYKLYI